VARPGYVEADFQLGELIFHWGASLGIPASDAREPFSRVLAAEPGNVQAALHLVRLAARDGRYREVDSLGAAIQRVDPVGTIQLEVEALRAFLSTDRGWQDRLVAVAALRPERDRAILEHMAAFSYNLGDIGRAARAGPGAERTPVAEARMQLFLTQVELGRGRYRDALATIASPSALPAPRQLEYRAMMATLPFLPLPADELETVRSRIAGHPDLDLHEEGGPIADAGIEYPHLLWPGLHRPVRLYLLGSLHARLGDVDAAYAVADSLARFDPDDETSIHYERITRARADAAAGRPTAALRTLGPVRPPPNRTFESLVDHARPYERWLRAEILRETGRLSEALRWYGTFPDPMARDLPYVAPSHLRRAEIHDAAGDHAQAAFHYRRFIDLWADADPELQPEVTRARGRLRHVEGR
jgi:tetratricopeptide (TPR) repeat protein